MSAFDVRVQRETRMLQTSRARKHGKDRRVQAQSMNPRWWGKEKRTKQELIGLILDVEAMAEVWSDSDLALEIWEYMEDYEVGRFDSGYVEDLLRDLRDLEEADWIADTNGSCRLAFNDDYDAFSDYWAERDYGYN